MLELRATFGEDSCSDHLERLRLIKCFHHSDSDRLATNYMLSDEPKTVDIQLIYTEYNFSIPAHLHTQSSVTSILGISQSFICDKQEARSKRSSLCSKRSIRNHGPVATEVASQRGQRRNGVGELGMKRRQLRYRKQRWADPSGLSPPANGSHHATSFALLRFQERRSTVGEREKGGEGERRGGGGGVHRSTAMRPLVATASAAANQRARRVMLSAH